MARKWPPKAEEMLSALRGGACVSEVRPPDATWRRWRARPGFEDAVQEAIEHYWRNRPRPLSEKGLDLLREAEEIARREQDGRLMVQIAVQYRDWPPSADAESMDASDSGVV